MVDVKIVGFLSLAAGAGVLAEIFFNISRFPLDVIGGVLAVIAGLLGIFKGY